MTREEIINVLQDDKMMPFIQPDQLARIVDFVSENYKPSLPEGLEEAARLYAIPHYMKDIDVNYIDEYPYDSGLETAFIAGAKWQKKRDDLETADLLAIAHLQGMEQQKAKMMEGAVEHFVIGEIDGHPVGPVIVHYDEDLNIGDKVRVIVIKED